MVSKRQLLLAVTAGLAVLVLGTSASFADYVPGQILVKYRSDIKRTDSLMTPLYHVLGVSSVYRFSGAMEGLEQITLATDESIESAIEVLSRNPNIEYAQPNYKLYLMPNESAPKPKAGRGPCWPGTPPEECDPTECWIPGVNFPPGCHAGEGGGGGPIPIPTGEPGGGEPSNPPAEDPALNAVPAEVTPPVADPRLSEAYGIAKVGAPAAWDINKGHKEFIVAVIDTGIDYNHEDLAFNVWRNPNPGPKNDVVGYDFVHDDGAPFDDHMHGSHCAGTIGAVGGNGKGVAGVNQRVSIMGLKFLSAQGEGDTAGAIKAIDYAIEHGARVLSNSWGGKGDEQNTALHDAIDRAKAKDVLFIAAAGNDGANNDLADPSYPAAFDNDNLISVAATDKNDKMASFSNYGVKTTHLAAPGVSILSTIPGNKYFKLDGTSMACPHVAGAAALLWSHHPEWNYKRVKETLMKTVDPLPALSGKTVTGGRINVFNALRSTD